MCFYNGLEFGHGLRNGGNIEYIGVEGMTILNVGSIFTCKDSVCEKV